MSTVKASDVIVEALERELEDIFREHHDMVFRTAYGVLGNTLDAEDVVQAIFLRMLDRGISPDVTRNPAGYLYKSAVNESLNVIRARKRLVLDPDSERLAARTAAEPSVRAEEIHQCLYQAVAKLNPRSAHILILRYIHQYSDVEIAKMLGTSRGTIAVTLYRTRVQLRKWLTASLYGDNS